ISDQNWSEREDFNISVYSSFQIPLSHGVLLSLIFFGKSLTYKNLERLMKRIPISYPILKPNFSSIISQLVVSVYVIQQHIKNVIYFEFLSACFRVRPAFLSRLFNGQASVV
ncbi:hypothetical protein BC833DRAFT_570102, partial [Globomyces pollinis-pini]